MRDRLNEMSQDTSAMRSEMREMNELFDEMHRRFDTIDRLFLWLYIYLAVIWVTVMLTILLAN
jgi:hypothetical protein